MLFQHNSGPLGFTPSRLAAPCIARAAFSAGQVGRLDLGQSDADVTNANFNDANGAFSNVVAIDANEDEHDIYVIAENDVADNGQTKFIMVGVTTAKVGSGEASIPNNAPLYVNPAEVLEYSANPPTSARIIAKTLEANASPTAVGSGGSDMKVLFFGYGNFLSDPGT